MLALNLRQAQRQVEGSAVWLNSILGSHLHDWLWHGEHIFLTQLKVCNELGQVSVNL